MGKKNKKNAAGKNPKENEPPKDNEGGASGGPPDEKKMEKKDAKQGSEDQKGKKQQKQMETEQKQQKSDPQESFIKQGARPKKPSQQQEKSSQQQETREEPSQQAEAAWSRTERKQKGSQGGFNQPPQQRPQGSQGGYNQPQQPQAAWSGSERRPQGSQGGYNQPQQPQAGWSGSERRPQGSQGGYNQPPQQRPQGSQGGYNQPQQPQAAWSGSERRPQGSQGGYNQPPQQRPQGSQGGNNQPQQPQAAWSGSERRPQGSQGGYNQPPQQRPQGSQGGYNQPQQQQRSGGDRSQQQNPRRDSGQQGARYKDHSRSSGGSYQDERQYQSPPQQQAPVKLVPPNVNGIKRGTKGNPYELETNYLTLDLSKMPDVAYHYDVKIDPDRPKKFLRQAFDGYVRKLFPKFHLAYDGRASAYSVDLLPKQILDANQGLEVEITEGSRKLHFKVTLMATEDLQVDLKLLKSYHKERIFDKPMRAMQCIEVALSAPCHEKGTHAGRSYFIQPPSKIDLGDGYELWYGLYQAAMLCDQPLLNVDVSHKSFPSEVNLVTFYDRLPYKPMLDEFLKGLRVIYTPPASFKSEPKGFKYIQTKNASSAQKFKTEDGKELTVAEYFHQKGYTLKQPNLPCLHVGSTVKNIYIPLELLSVPPGQAIMRKDSDRQVREIIRYAATSTDKRKEKIMRLVEYFNYNVHPTVQRFGLSVDLRFIQIKARLLQPPKIQYAEKSIVISRPGEWMMNNVSFLNCDRRTIHQWAIINISGNRNINENFLRQNFVSLVVSCSKGLKMSLAEQCNQIIEPRLPSQRNAVISIKAELQKLKRDKISIVFVILHFSSESYARVKQEAELSCGIVTQCIKGNTVRSESQKYGVKIINQMTINNILLKVNAKLNGTNHKIAPSDDIATLASKVMFVGADVSHPSPLQKNLPSIVGVVASHDLYGTKYNMQYRLQEAGLETIKDMKEIFTHHLNVYMKQTGNLPEYILYYRDGVSDGQFPLIQKIEIEAMRAACKMMKCKAKITCIIVVKRHHTRFFPQQKDAEGSFKNVKAGTVVDQTIIHPNEVQFFMVSHKAIQGTSKPTRYNVIVDDAKIDIDDIQQLTYNLCHLFPRCNRSVSYPAPAYLAHLVGLRGRAYIEGSNLNLENLEAEYRKRIVSSEVMNMNPMYFV